MNSFQFNASMVGLGYEVWGGGGGGVGFGVGVHKGHSLCVNWEGNLLGLRCGPLKGGGSGMGYLLSLSSSTVKNNL